MQKVLRRTALAKAQAARRATRRVEKNASIQRTIDKQQNGIAQKQVARDIREARLVRREEQDLGPLAPRRDVGDQRDTYGTIDQRRIKGPPVPREERTRFWNLVPGDRVVILEGRDKGRIGKIKKLEAKSEEVIVDGLNLVDIAIPKWMIKDEEPDKRPVRSIEAALPLSSVRLVHPLTDASTGQTRDVIVKTLVNGRVWFDRHSGTQRWSRYIAGLDIKIPWPKKEAKQQSEHDVDTLRAEVEARTWVPTLLRPPMPPSVIDELRNKFSRFRDRHDPEYIAAKTAEDEAEREQQAGTAMVTPLKEAKRRARRERKSVGKGVLSTDMLERIGEVMARNGRVSPVPPPQGSQQQEAAAS
ncbi:MAG: hypothetical protein M1832_000089 [Thelocarpon impressellum]|nr:MAG: hypothetical protein M1832_000089 [Thelocarpon impressellum]